jgi:hypothetical protein
LADDRQVKKIKDENGAVVVEAALYFPITIAIVMVILYLGLYKIQESYFFFEVERAASLLAREAAYPGYDSFTGDDPLNGTAIDFDLSAGVGADQISSYYAAYNGSLSKIYRWGLNSATQQRVSKYQEALCKKAALFSLGTTEAHVQVNNGFLSSSVQAEISYVIPLPGIIQFLGAGDKITIYAAAYQPVINSTDLVRNVDLAVDMGNFLLKKLGLDGKVQEFVNKFNRVKELLL